jgi:hypothetical protein
MKWKLNLSFVPFVSFVFENAHTYSTSFHGKCDCGRQGHFSNREGSCRFAWSGPWRWAGAGRISSPRKLPTLRIFEDGAGKVELYRSWM